MLQQNIFVHKGVEFQSVSVGKCSHQQVEKVYTIQIEL